MHRNRAKSISEFCKRPREEEEINPFRRTAKMKRSTENLVGEASGETMEDTLKAILGEMRGMRKENMDLKEKVEQMTEELKTMKNNNKSMMEEWKIDKDQRRKEMERWRIDIEEKTNNRMKQLEEKVERMEQNERRNNIIIKGHEFVGGNLKEHVKAFIKEKLNVNVEVNWASAVGGAGSGKKNTIVQLREYNMKRNVMESKGKLRDVKEGRIFIDSDYTKKEREIQAKLRKIALEEKQKGIRVKIGYKKIQLNGVWKMWREIEAKN